MDRLIFLSDIFKSNISNIANILIWCDLDCCLVYRKDADVDMIMGEDKHPSAVLCSVVVG